MWCPSTDSLAGDSGIPAPHHRIVRIPPGEAVALNSAERAPYLLYIEVLRDDLDFDPGKRSNKAILRKVIMKEGGSRHGWMDSALPSSLLLTTPRRSGTDGGLRTPYTAMTQTSFPDGPPTAASSTSTFSNDDEEVDLVEQLYGGDQPLRSKMLDIEDSIILPPTPKNRELDMAAWSRVSLPEDSRLQLQDPRNHSRARSLSRAPSSAPPVIIAPSEPEPARALSLDEYSDRMRTAAIMLAQLNTDQGRDPSPLSRKINDTSCQDANHSRKFPS